MSREKKKKRGAFQTLGRGGGGARADISSRDCRHIRNTQRGVKKRDCHTLRFDSLCKYPTRRSLGTSSLFLLIIYYYYNFFFLNSKKEKKKERKKEYNYLFDLLPWSPTGRESMAATLRPPQKKHEKKKKNVESIRLIAFGFVSFELLARVFYLYLGRRVWLSVRLLLGLCAGQNGRQGRRIVRFSLAKAVTDASPQTHTHTHAHKSNRHINNGQGKRPRTERKRNQKKEKEKSNQIKWDQDVKRRSHGRQ